MADFSEIARLRRAVEYADTRAVSRAAYPHACIEDRRLRDLIDFALRPAAEPCLTSEEQLFQAARCSCRGSDDYCPCQNVPDDETRHTRAETAR